MSDQSAAPAGSEERERLAKMCDDQDRWTGYEIDDAFEQTERDELKAKARDWRTIAAIVRGAVSEERIEAAAREITERYIPPKFPGFADEVGRNVARLRRHFGAPEPDRGSTGLSGEANHGLPGAGSDRPAPGSTESENG